MSVLRFNRQTGLSLWCQTVHIIAIAILLTSVYVLSFRLIA